MRDIHDTSELVSELVFNKDGKTHLLFGFEDQPIGMVVRYELLTSWRRQLGRFADFDRDSGTLDALLAAEELTEWIARTFHLETAFDIFGDTELGVTFVVPRDQGAQTVMKIAIVVQQSQREEFLGLLRQKLISTSAWRRERLDPADDLYAAIKRKPKWLPEFLCNRGWHVLPRARWVPGELLHASCVCGEKEQLRLPSAAPNYRNTD